MAWRLIGTKPLSEQMLVTHTAIFHIFAVSINIIENNKGLLLHRCIYHYNKRRCSRYSYIYDILKRDVNITFGKLWTVGVSAYIFDASHKICTRYGCALFCCVCTMSQGCFALALGQLYNCQQSNLEEHEQLDGMEPLRTHGDAGFILGMGSANET